MELESGYKQTDLGVIPNEWTVERLSTVCSMKSGESITSRDLSPLAAYPCYGGNGLRGFTDRFTHEGQFVLIGRQGALCGNVAGVDGKFFASEHAIVVAGSPRVNMRWLALVLAEMRLNRYSESSAQPGLSVSKLLQLSVVFPTRTEQDAVAAAIGDAASNVSALDELIAKKRRMKQGALRLLLSGKRRLPGYNEGWPHVRLGELFIFKNGLNKAKEFFGRGTPIVNYMDVFQSPSVLTTDLTGQVSLTNEELSNFDVRRGDVFFTRTSETREDVGVASVVINEPIQTVFSGFLLRARPKDAKLRDEFKAYCFQSEPVRRQITSTASYTTRALTNGRALSAVTLPVPSIDEQLAIAATLSDLDAEIAALGAQLAKARLIKQGMMQNLLTGKIRLV